MNPLHSPRNEHSKSEFGKKNSEERFAESETFSGSKFDSASGVMSCFQKSAVFFKNVFPAVLMKLLIINQLPNSYGARHSEKMYAWLVFIVRRKFWRLASLYQNADHGTKHTNCTNKVFFCNLRNIIALEVATNFNFTAAEIAFACKPFEQICKKVFTCQKYAWTWVLFEGY